MQQLPQTILTITLWSYWISVLIMAARSHVKHKTPAGLLPKTTRETRMWALWVPTVLLWLLLPIVAQRTSLPILATPQIATLHPVAALIQGLAAVAAMSAFAMTIPCWLTLGPNWSLAIVPEKGTRLVTRGVFAYVRHPIYALSVILMVATVVVVPSLAMLVVASLHLVLLHLKAKNEENHLSRIHGRTYLDYCSRTGRFFPRFWTPTGSL